MVSILSHRSQQVMVDGCRSKLVIVVSGVPQGSVPGPLLFQYGQEKAGKEILTTRLYIQDWLNYILGEIAHQTLKDIIVKNIRTLEYSRTYKVY